MDSAHEEPELPSAIQDLVQRLEGQGEPITELPRLRDPEFREFFPEWSWTIIGWRSQVRRRVLEAIGSCNTIEILDMGNICGRDISRLTPSEWEVVLRGFRSSTVLEKIIVHGRYLADDADKESLCFQLGRILNSSSVTELEVNASLSARCFSNLASGLQGRSDSKLKSLDLVGAWEDSSAVKYVADMINSAPLLETLRLGGWYWEDMEDETVGILSQALIQSLALKEFTLSGNGKWAGPLLLKALAGDDRNRYIERLRLRDMVGVGDCLRELLISNPSLKEVKLDGLEGMEPEQAHQLGEAIRDNAIATTIRVKFDFRFDDWKSIEALARSASSDVNDPTLEITLVTQSEDKVMLSLNLLGRVLRGEITSLKSLSIRNLVSSINQDRRESILSMNGRTGETCVLKRLGLSALSEDVWKGVWKDLLLCLRGNTSLTHLDLSENWLDEEMFRDMMGLLQVNLSLQEINVSRTSWATDGKAALIQEALKQNKMRADYMFVFREAGLAFGDAKAGRLFLCGSPRAGKTQLRQTLIHGRSWQWAKFKWRTEGIEVDFLQNNKERQISIWDLAGQDIFRTLQSVLFPRASNFCLFLFVYSPFCQKEKKDKKISCLETELEEWLNFITSCTRITGHSLPQVLVVISHKDKARFKSLTWAQNIVKKLTEKFARFVDLHPFQEFFHVDGRKKKQVRPLKKHISEIFDDLLSKKSPRVPQLCSQLSYLLAKDTKKNRRCPLWQSKKFSEFCFKMLTDFIPISSAHAKDHSEMMKSITSYMNDVGSIVSIPNLDYIIVDPNWLTNKLLGELVAVGQNFLKKTSSVSYASKDGFVSEDVFAWSIEEFLKKQPEVKISVDRDTEIGVDRKVIENILINLDLCFKAEDPFQYFIPSFVPEYASAERQIPQELADETSKKWRSRVGASKFVGIRIQCQDERTMSLNAGFFPCFEIFMRRKLISEMNVSEKTMTCSRHYMQLNLDGHEIYLEQGTSRNYVDVLMLCSDHKSREMAITYVMKHIVHELISFCASSKGCPGVALVLGLIQTRCVEMLIPIHLRGAILIEKLKSNFIRYINDKLEDYPSDRVHLVKEEELFSYEYPWPPIQGHITKVIQERARELLWERDVEEIVNVTRQKQMQSLESFRQDLSQQLGSVQQGVDEVKKDLIHSYPENENMVTMNDSNRPSSSRASTSEICEIRDALGRIEKKVDGFDERLRLGLQRLETKMEEILFLQRQLQSTLSDFVSKVDRIIGYTQSFQQTRTPKRPYITDDVNNFYRLSAFMHGAKTVRLHLMCESATGFHVVEDQEGLKIRVNLDDQKWISKTIEISYKVLYYTAKAGLSMKFGLGQAIPDWADLKSDIVKLDGISDGDRSAVVKAGKSEELTQAWLRIQKRLGEINYAKIFKLYLVKYEGVESGGHAWVCEECMKEGIRTGILSAN